MTSKKLFVLNDTDWVFDAHDEEEATRDMIDQVCGAKTVAEYEKYCSEAGVDADITWTELDEASTQTNGR